MNAAKLSISIAVGICATLLSGSNVLAQSRSDQLRVVEADSIDGQQVHGESQTFEIRVENGEVTVKHNGKLVPQDRIKHEDGSVTILDQHGQPLKDFNVMVQPFDFKTGRVEHLRALVGEQGPPPKVMLGVQMGEPSEQLEYHLQLNSGESTLITGLYEGLPAREAGLDRYDIIVKVDGKAPATATAIKEALAAKEPGDTIVFTVIQKGTQRDVKVRLQAYDAQAMASAKLIGEEASGLTQRFLRLVPKHMEEGLFVMPEMQELRGRLEGQIDLRNPTLRAETKDIDKQLQQLDKRMAELEKLLEKLIEREAQGR